MIGKLNEGYLFRVCSQDKAKAMVRIPSNSGPPPLVNLLYHSIISHHLRERGAVLGGGRPRIQPSFSIYRPFFLQYLQTPCLCGHIPISSFLVLGRMSKNRYGEEGRKTVPGREASACTSLSTGRHMQVQGDGEVRPVSWNDVMRLGRAAGPDHGQPVHPSSVLLRARGGTGH